MFEEVDEDDEVIEDNKADNIEVEENPIDDTNKDEKAVEETIEVKGKKEEKNNVEYENVTLDEISEDEEEITEPVMDDGNIQELDEDMLEEVTEDDTVDTSVRKSKIKVKSPRDERKAIEQEDVNLEEKALEEYAASLPDVKEVELTEEEKEKFINADEDAKSEAEEAYEAMYGVEEEEKEEEDDDDEEEEVKESIYPEELVDLELECVFIGLLFNNPKAISRFYFLYEDCKFSDEELMNLYKIVLFRDGEAYAPAIAKDKYQLPRENPHTYDLKYKVRKIAASKDYDTEEVYTKLKKLFILKKYYMIAATRVLQDNILKIKDYELYKDMTVEEVKNAIDQLTVTTGLSQDVLNHNATQFLLEGDNELANGLRLPFEILTTVFKGIRKGETMCFAMPSNSGKSRFTINLASYIAFIHKQKVLVISNEMSVEKMKLCMITTILNNPEIQGLHGQPVRKTEGELLELKFRADNPKRIKCDEDGFIIRKEGETQEEYIAKLAKYSKEFKMTCAATDWLETQMNNSIYFIHITEHTNDDLKKVIMNYYYKEGIEYMFYDTLKADVANIGNSDEVKKTATILSNIAQKYKTFIASSMQLIESNTLPVNLTVNEMSASKTVKEVLDTLCLIKQISRHTLHKYEYAPTDQFDECHDIDVPKDTDVRFYACVVDKNRAGAKPTLLFRLNLAYNEWEELGHLRLKQTEDYDE